MHDFLLTHDTPAQYARALHETVDVLAVHLAGARSPRSAAASYRPVSTRPLTRTRWSR